MSDTENDETTQEWSVLERIYDDLENVEMLPETLLQLAEQAKKLAHLLDPQRTKEISEAEQMKCFLEPHFIGVVRASGDLFVNRKRYGTECYVYFGKKVK